MASTTSAPFLTHKISDKFAIEFVRIEPGYFLMGGNDEGAFDSEKNIHLVNVKNTYYLSKTPITQTQWAAVMQGDNQDPSIFKGRNNPVERVSWQDIMQGGQANGNKASFISMLGASPIKGLKFTLPTEAQWEYAAKDGHLAALTDAEVQQWKKFEEGFNLKTKKAKKIKTADSYALYSGSDRQKEVGWKGIWDYLDEKELLTRGMSELEIIHPAGLKRPNPLGLFDMSSNIWEWCIDKWQFDYPLNEQSEAPYLVQDLDSLRVFRGGSWSYEPLKCRITRRYRDAYGTRGGHLGFRLALSMPFTE